MHDEVEDEDEDENSLRIKYSSYLTSNTQQASRQQKKEERGRSRQSYYDAQSAKERGGYYLL